MTTSTFGTSSNAPTYAQGQSSGADATWDAAWDAAGYSLLDDGFMRFLTAFAYVAKGAYYTAYIARTVLNFDTTAIPDGDTIESVTLTVRGLSYSGTGQISIQQATGNGFQNYTGTALATPTLSGTVNEISLPTSCIVKDGTTALMLRGIEDYVNYAANSGATIYSRTASTESFRPFLTVVHSAGGSTVPPLHLLRSDVIPPLGGF